MNAIADIKEHCITEIVEILEAAYEDTALRLTIAQQHVKENWSAYRWGLIQGHVRVLECLTHPDELERIHEQGGYLSQIVKERLQWDERMREVVNYMEAIIQV
ncbi:MAG: hypothetical protein AAGD25_06885 [Cyanobacteria bacterium P01_F01_bin.150]